MKRYWLMKSEPSVYSIDDLSRDKFTPWEGVRNYQARNFMLHDMKAGDVVLFYHSNAEPSGIAGLGKIKGEAKADASQFNKKSDFYDPKSTPANPRWQCVDVEFLEKFPRVIDLQEIRMHAALKDMLVLKKGQRLSIQPVTSKEFDFILRLAKS